MAVETSEAKCEKILPYLEDYTGDADRLPLEIRQHLEECRVCSESLSVWTRILSRMRDAPMVEPPLELNAAIIKHVVKHVENDLAASEKERVFWPWSLAAMLLGVLGLGIWYFQNQVRSTEVTPIAVQAKPSAEKPEASRNPVKTKARPHYNFRVALKNKSAKKVNVVGDFNHWNKDAYPLKQNDAGEWVLNLQLEKGCYQYQILIDGNEWTLDPLNPNQAYDGFGGSNSVVLL